MRGVAEHWGIQMSGGVITAIVIGACVVLALLAALVFLGVQMRARIRLRERFGPEYDRAMARHGSRRASEQALRARAQRHQSLELKPPVPQARDRYAQQWRTAQAHFVDQPGQAIGEADRLITALMDERGYPAGHYDQPVADLSVEHGPVLEHYRAVHESHQRSSQGQTSAEDLRTAMVHYRALFDDLLGSKGQARRGDMRQRR
jgi:hypothetical protein